MKDPSFAKLVVFVNGLVPGALLAWDAWNHNLGTDPQNRAIHVTGMTALIFLMLTLTVTPLRKLSGWNWLSHFRRMLGLFAFAYASSHFLIYFAYERGFSMGAVIRDALDHNFIFFGMTALVLMIPLAATSTNGIIKRMGAARWKRLHKLVYVCAIMAVLHYTLFGKLGGINVFRDFSHWTQELFICVLALLLAYRVIAAGAKASPRPLPARPSEKV